MLISHRYKFIFFKAKKVSGTSTEAYLERYCLSEEEEKTHSHNHNIKELVTENGIIGSRITHNKVMLWYNHKKPMEIKKDIGENIFNSYKKITNIRNPYDVVVSYYFYKSYGVGQLNSRPTVSGFENFLKTNLDFFIDNKDYWIMNGEFFNDFYIRQENLEEDLFNLLGNLNLPNYDQEIPTYKVIKNRPHYSEFFNDSTKKIIDDNFSDIIEKFNYKF